MPPYLDELESWYRAYCESGGRRQVRVELHQGPPERPKRAAWVVVEGLHAGGQMTVWESGECDTDALGQPTTGEQTTILLRSRVLPLPAAVAAVADDLVDHVADYSGT